MQHTIRGFSLSRAPSEQGLEQISQLKTPCKSFESVRRVNVQGPRTIWPLLIESKEPTLFSASQHDLTGDIAETSINTDDFAIFVEFIMLA